MTKHYHELCLYYFTTGRGGKMIKKMEFHRPLLHGKTTLTMADVSQVVDLVVLNSIIDQTGALVNTLQDFIKETLEGMMS